MLEIPELVWKSELRHKEIWKSAGPCVTCRALPRELMCRFCGEPMCVGCLSQHEKQEHQRDAYIERLAKSLRLQGSPKYAGKVLLFDTASAEEQTEARALLAKWDAVEAESLKAMSATG